MDLELNISTSLVGVMSVNIQSTLVFAQLIAAITEKNSNFPMQIFSRFDALTLRK